jgi:glycosyltransferase involved in cell wall biosynthesis
MPALTDIVGEHAGRTAVVPNMLSERLWFGPQRIPAPAARIAATDGVGTGDRLRLVYIGTKTHGGDLQLLRPVLPELRARLGRQVTLEVIGGEPEGPGQEWYERVPVPRGCVAYPEFVAWLRAQRERWDVAVAPLANTPFNMFKSDLKFLEYSALGLPGVYSDGSAYGSTVEPSITGALASSHDQWVDALEMFGRDQQARRTVAEAAKRYVIEQRTMRVSTASYLDLLLSALEERG